MTNSTVERRSVVDWRAAIIAGLVAGLLFLIFQLAATTALVGTPWGALRYIASLALGKEILPPPHTFVANAVVVGVLIHLFFSVVFACVLALIVHRGGLITGIVGGALFGLALYAINYYSFSFFFPWFFALRSWIVIAAHVLYGAAAGGLYEALERDNLIVIEEGAHV